MPQTLCPSTSMTHSDVDARPTKKRKVQRACDHCRKYKRKCDGPRAPDNVCSLCKSAHRTCTYLEASKPRGPPKAYVTGLEDRVEQLEKLLMKLQPGEDFTDELGPPVMRDSWKAGQQPIPSANVISIVGPEALVPLNVPVTQALFSTLQPYTHDQHGNRTPPQMTGIPRSRLGSVYRHTAAAPSKSKHSSTDSESDGQSPSDDEADDLVDGLKKLALMSKEDMDPEKDWSNVRFLGKSSGMELIGTTMRFKLGQESCGSPSWEKKESFCRASKLPVPLTLRRPEMWKVPYWEYVWEGDGNYPQERHAVIIGCFPPPDLTKTLLDLYFSHVNPMYPLFHQPSFRRQYGAKLYEEDPWFAAVCLLVFSVASRWCNDPRVLPDGNIKTERLEGDDRDWRPAGYTWFQLAFHITRSKFSGIRPPSLFEIQTFPLIGLYLRGTPGDACSRMLYSAGIRKCQDVGAHRKKRYGAKPTYHDEMWKRVFWCLVVLDRFNSALFGRPSTVDDDHFDLDLPLEVDDEYWATETNEAPWEQPDDRPPTIIIAFRCLIKLSSIFALTLRTHCATDRSRMFIRTLIMDWEEKMVAELHQACEDWFASIPPQLKWSDKIEDELLFNLSSNLNLTYHHLQIQLYRPYISVLSWKSDPKRRPAGSLYNSALSTCLQAAKKILRILDHSYSHKFWAIPEIMCAARNSAAIFIIRIWELKGAQRRCLVSGKPADPAWEKETEQLFEDVEASMQVLRLIHPRWEQARSSVSELQHCMPAYEGTASPSTHTISSCTESESRLPFDPCPTYPPQPAPNGHTSPPMATLANACPSVSTAPHAYSQPHATAHHTWNAPSGVTHKQDWTLPSANSVGWASGVHQYQSAETRDAASMDHTNYGRELSIPEVSGICRYTAHSAQTELEYHPVTRYHELDEHPYERTVLQHRYPPLANAPTMYDRPAYSALSSYGQPVASASYGTSSALAPPSQTGLSATHYTPPITSSNSYNTNRHANEGEDVFMNHYHQSHSRLPYQLPDHTSFYYLP